MRVSILYQFFQGSEEPGHNLLLSFAHYLQQKGEHVSVISGEYGYMSPKPVGVPIWRRIIRHSTVEGIPVTRTYTYPYSHRSALVRALSFFSFAVTSTLALFSGARPDIIYASSPPLLLGLSAWLASRFRRVPLVLEIRDLWPASFVALSGRGRGAPVRLMSWLERFLYDRSAFIIALTEGIRRDIVKRGWPAEKVYVVGYAISPARFHRDEHAGSRIRAKLGWADQKVVAYFGAHGRANNLDVVLRAALRLKDRQDIHFVLIGDGMEKSRLVEDAKRAGLRNLEFLPPVAANEMAAYINAADMCLATLRDVPLFRGAVPSKLIEYMACGRPVIVCARGEAENIVSAADAGLICEPDDDNSLAASIEALADDPDRRTRLGLNGRAAALQQFFLERNLAELHHLLAVAAGERIKAKPLEAQAGH
jgi:glycosyltransferase involved in cell wall biosynthesis